MVLIAVEDSGPGIAPEAMERLFQKSWPKITKVFGAAFSKSCVNAAFFVKKAAPKKLL